MSCLHISGDSSCQQRKWSRRRQEGSPVNHNNYHDDKPSKVRNQVASHHCSRTGIPSSRWLWLVASLLLIDLPNTRASMKASWSPVQESNGAIRHRDLETDGGIHEQHHRRNLIEEDAGDVFHYYSSPKLNWMTRLEGSAELQQGNAVVPSPYYDEILYVTTNDGRFSVRNAIDGSSIYSYVPPKKEVKKGDGEQEWTTRCYSSIAFGESENIGKFLVYAIVYEPPEGVNVSPQSQVIAFSIPNHELLWTSLELPGVIQGTPVVNSNQNDPWRKYIVITRNTIQTQPEGTFLTTGHVSILQSLDAKLVWTESETVFNDIMSQGYGPPGIASEPKNGKYDGGMDNGSDLIVWSNSAQDGKGNSGNTFAFQLPAFFHEASEQIENLKSVRLKEVRWTSVARPVLSRDGQAMYIGVSGSELRGWTSTTRFDTAANLKTELRPDHENPQAAIPTAPVLSLDEQRLFASSASTDLTCVDAMTGTKLWDLSGQSPFLVESRVSPDDARVYNIQSADGRVSCQEQETGKLLWIINCDNFEEDCANSVRANFGLSSNGKYLYYGDVMGRIVSLKLGEYKSSKTDAPVRSPSLSPPFPPSPTVVIPIDPTMGSQWPDQTQAVNPMRRGPTLGGSIALIVIATMIGVGAAMYIVKVSPLKTHPHPQQEAHCSDDDNENNNNRHNTSGSSGNSGDFDWENRLNNGGTLENVPDPYEDAMLSKHSSSKNRERTYIPSRYETPPRRHHLRHHHQRRKDVDDGASIVSSNSIPAADRFAQVMGTSNQVLPLHKPGTPGSEDYSFGASLIL